MDAKTKPAVTGEELAKHMADVLMCKERHYLDERARVLAILAYHETQYHKGSKQRQLLEILYKHIESGKPAPQGRLIP